MQGIRQQDNKLICEFNHEIVQLEPWGRDSLRVRATPGPAILEDLPGALLAPDPTEVEIEIHTERAVIQNGAIRGEVVLDRSKGPGAIFDAYQLRFFNTETGLEVLAEKRPQFRWPPARYFRAEAGDLFRLEVWFKAHDDERLYGLGQHQHGRLNQKGCVIDLVQRNTEVNIPFLVSSRGYGFLWNNPGVGRVDLGYNGTRWVAEGTRQMDYWLTVGRTPADIMERYAEATGHAPPLPAWAAGFWQSKLRYQTQDELLSVAREYKERGLPLAVIVIDYFHWTVQGDWQFDPKCWPDPAGMVRELEEMGVKPMVSIWPTVNQLSSNFEQMRQRGLLLRSERGIPAHKPFQDTKPEGLVYVQFYDATNPEARQFVWQEVRDNYYRRGVRLWWLDACEPDMIPGDPDNQRYHLGNGLEVANLYPLLHTQGFFEGMRAEGEEEVVLLCRSAWAGSQRYGAIVWSGDIPSTFESLQAQFRAGLNIGLSGIPWWTTDIGGFFDGDPASPEFRELIIRWFQYGVFCPIFRLHGYRLPAAQKNGGPNEAWSFGDEAYEIIKALMFLRERLRPYIMTQFEAARRKGTPLIRPLFFDFPKDEICFSIEDQLMFGPDLLVAPVLHEGIRRRQVYLPAGTTWIDAWTNKTLEGGQSFTAEAPLDRIPLYLRAGASLPIR